MTMFSLSRILPAAAALAAGFTATVALPAHAGEGMSVEFGSGTKTQMLRIAGQSYWKETWFESNGTHLSGYWDANFALWRANQWQNVKGQTQTLYTLGFTPVFRFEKSDRKGWYAEGGIGANYVSKLYDNNDFKLSTHFEFGDHVGVGYVFNNGLDLTFKVQHYSNGGIKKPNTGVNFLVLKAGWAM